MAGEQDPEQKTEAPSPKRLRDARLKGQVALAPETKHAAMFAGALLVTGAFLTTLAERLGVLFVRLMAGAHDYALDPGGAANLMWGLAGALGLALAPVFAVLLFAAILGGLAQGRPTLSWTRLKPNWAKFSPLGNLKRMFGIVEFAKTLAKFSVVIVAAVLVVLPDIWALERVLVVGAGGLVGMALNLLWRLLLTVTIIVLVIALADNLYQRFAFLKKMRMTRQEVKDEYKEAEGDPHLKARVRAIQRERSRHRMMAAVPTASVVITNPTHYAVALRYEHGKSRAPVVVAKGVDEVAARIREIAKASGVPLYANPPLARALHATVDIDREVPAEHYIAVAEVISYVMRLKGGRQ